MALIKYVEIQQGNGDVDKGEYWSLKSVWYDAKTKMFAMSIGLWEDKAAYDAGEPMLTEQLRVFDNYVMDYAEISQAGSSERKKAYDELKNKAGDLWTNAVDDLED